MTQPKLKQQAIFPDLPRESKMIDPSTGNIMPVWDLYFQQQQQALQTILSQQGFRMPSQTTTDITTINAGVQLNGVATIVYDSDLQVWKGIKVNPSPGPDDPATKVVIFTTS